MKPLKISAVGDIMLGEQPLCLGFGVKSVISRKGLEYIFHSVRPFLHESDITIGNLEGPLSLKSSKTGLEKDFFRGHPSYAPALRDTGFNVLSLANNHIMDHGLEAFNETVTVLRANGILPIGVSGETPVLKVKGHSVDFVSYSLVKDNLSDVPYKKATSPEPIVNEVKLTKNEADLVIVYLHWGDEYIHYPSPDQIRLGRKLIDAGADMVFGSHSHVLQGYEIYKGKPIVYGLGNFVFDHYYIPETRKTGIFQVIIDENLGMKSVFVPALLNSEYCPIVSKEDEDVTNLIESIRRIIEGQEVNSYLSTLNDYEQLRIKCHSHAKRLMRLHFLKNLHKYPLSLILMLTLHRGG